MERILTKHKRRGPANWKTSGQLITVYVLAVFLPLVIIGSYLISTVSKVQKNYYADMLSTNNAGVRQTLYEITYQIFTASDSIVYNDDLIEFLDGEYETEQDMLTAASKTELLDKYAARYAGIEQITVYVDRDDMVNYGEFVKVTDEIRESDWYKRASEQYIPFWLAYESSNRQNSNKSWNLVLVRKMVLVGGEREAVIMIKVRDSYLASRLSNSGYTTLVFVGDGQAAFSTSLSLYGTTTDIDIDYNDEYYDYCGETVFNGQESLVCVNTLSLSKSSNRLYLVTYDTEALDIVKRIVRTNYIIMIIAIVLPLLIITWFTKRFTSQVRTLRNEMGKASRGEFDEMSDRLYGSEELSEAFEDLQKMVSDIQRMEAEQYEAQIRNQNIINDQQKIEFKMLASQINPHFLYNTLETIRMKALTAGDTEVANATKLLGKSMRYVLENTGTRETTLQKELEHLEIYLQIQKMRFGDRIGFTIELEDGLVPSEYRMLPLLLQPVAENAVIHGLEGIESDGMVTIRASVDDRVLKIDISDNGGGIDAEELRSLNERLGSYKEEERTSSIGLYNINRRIKLSYGEEYGVTVYSTPGKGTTVSVAIPPQKQQ
jgi:two-component system sensor histidine kinase YesM